MHAETLYCYACGDPILLCMWRPYTAMHVETLYCYACGDPILLCMWRPYTAMHVETLYCYECGDPILLCMWRPYTAMHVETLYCYECGDPILLCMWRPYTDMQTWCAKFLKPLAVISWIRFTRFYGEAEKPKFGVRLSMHVWVMTVELWECSGLDVGACIF